ncbi:MAG: methyltransferase domain-containing protein [Fimbriimonadaceae bacterium]|nr:methyltransferase domain-containing protein [Fimbriimonadaceae bacterium]
MRSLEDRYWWYVSRRGLARSLVVANGAPGCPLLDLGCGTGAFLAEHGHGAVGLDFSPEAIECCRGRGLSRLVLADGSRAPFRDSSFGCVVSLDTIEHIADDRAAASEVARLLRPGGVFVVNVPAFTWLWGPHDVALHHRRRYTAKEVRRLLTGAGLEVRHLSYSVFFVFPAVLAVRMADKLRRGAARVRMPNVGDPINGLLIRLMMMEARLSRLVPLPWGSSIIAVAVRPESRGLDGS